MNNIPKILHLYWDRSQMSFLQTLTPISFHDLNPDWVINLYLPEKRDGNNSKYVPDYTGVDYFEELLKCDWLNVISVDSLGFQIPKSAVGILKSDYIRWQLLYNVGGVWCDFDVFWVKPFEFLNDSLGDTMTCRYNTFSGFYSVGVVYSIPQHSLIGKVVEINGNKPENLNPSYQVFGPDTWNENFKDQKVINTYENVACYPYHVFYPFSLYKLNLLFEFNLKPDEFIRESVCVHWFAGHTITKNYLNDHKWRERNCTLNNLIKMYL